jgi:hypothetical protein
MLERRSGLKYLKYELEAYKYALRYKIVNNFEYLIYTCIKVFIRILSKVILKKIYKFLLRD